jgi:hypothetical protein|tara:strand:- start:1251 stop:1442 length:192 start_codon:yes stop_codon:yes gene_type:complete
MISKFKTPKAIKSKQVIEKGLAKLGESLGLGKPFFAAITFSEKEGIFKICPCCGGQSLIKEFI